MDVYICYIILVHYYYISHVQTDAFCLLEAKTSLFCYLTQLTYCCI